MGTKRFCSLFFLSLFYVLCHGRALQNQEKEKQPGALAWWITCSCHLYRLIMIITDIISLSCGVPVDVYLGNFMFPIRPLLLSNPALREAKPDEDLGDFLQFQTDFKSTITIGVSPNPLNVFFLFISSAMGSAVRFTLTQSCVMLRSSQSELICWRMGGLIDELIPNL